MEEVNEIISYEEIHKKIDQFNQKCHCELKIREWVLELIKLVKDKSPKLKLIDLERILMRIFREKNWDLKLISDYLYPCWLAV